MEGTRSSFVCPHCDAEFTTTTNRNKHIRNVHPSTVYTCPLCGRVFITLNKLNLHLAGHSNSPPFPSSFDNLPTTTRNIYANNWLSVRTHSIIGENQSIYNFFWDPSEDAPQWRDQLLQMFHQQRFRFKINYSHSFLLRNRQNDELSFYHASVNNNSVLDTPRLVRDFRDFVSFLEELENTDILDHVRKQKPNSKYTVQAIMATSFYIYPVGFHIGCCSEDLPQATLYNKHIYCLQSDPLRKKPYTDNLCFFRCLALHKGATLLTLEEPTLQLFRRWWSDNPSEFLGVSLMDLENLEKLFSVNIDVFHYTDPSHDLSSLKLLSRSKGEYPTTMKLLQFSDHFMYIVNIHKLECCFECELCSAMFDTASGLRFHKRYCKNQLQSEKYVGGVYTPPESILSKLRRYNIPVDDSFVFPFRSTFDFEAYQEKIEKKTKHTTFFSKHVPLSVSVCSNVRGFCDPVCFVNEGDTQCMIDDMVDYLETVSLASYSILLEIFEQTFRELDRKIETNCPSIPAESLKDELDTYLRQLPVVGFNSSNYDINLSKPYLIRRIAKDLEFVVKRNNQYVCLSTPSLKFLDIVNFLAPGYSYSKYLKAFGVQEPKGYFCYEYVTSLDVLKETRLPPHPSFYSTLKKENITKDEYAYCQSIWIQNRMSTLKDFLVWYNNKDVVPFLRALQTQIDMYSTLGVDLLKDGISVPGITLKYLFKTISPGVYFSLFDSKRAYLHQLLRQNMVGGPSIIFHRYHEKGKTYIRNNPTKPVQAVVGYDANSLYLGCVSQQKMPTEHPIIRRIENDFRAEHIDKFGQISREWLEFESFKRQCQIRHKFNGKEHSLGGKRVRVDGFDAAGQVAFQFHGCLFHGHDCEKNRGKTINPINKRTLASLRQETADTSAYLRQSVGVTLVEMWECQWYKIKKDNPEVSQFVNERFSSVHCSFPRQKVTEHEILEAVKKEKLFGLVKCDLRVPVNLKDHFSELQPIFKNAMVSRDDIGQHMHDYAVEHKLLTQPRRTLIASYFAKDILLITPLLNWYITHGLVVSNVSLVIEYVPKTCFKQFGESVSDARRQGDSDPSKEILADTFKLLGNSAYGKTITNVANHRDVSYSDNRRDISKKVNDPRFLKLTELESGLVEIESKKKNILWNLPCQIGFFVYQYAKLRMLEFYYDFLDRFVSRSDFQLLEMDTDSFYLALSRLSLDEVVNPRLRRDFLSVYKNWFPSPSCENHYFQFVNSHETWAPCRLCSARTVYDKRTPGLFKVEYTGDCFVGLCSKTYFCEGLNKTKLSCKGLSKRHNDLTLSSYKEVLDTKQSGGGVNVGFRTDGRSVFTYFQNRKSLSYFYIKRRLSQDGVSTLPILV